MSIRNIGVDVGVDSIKIVVAEVSLQQTRIIDYVEQDRVSDVLEEIVNTVRTMIEKYDYKSNNTCVLVGFATDRIYSRLLHFPFDSLKRSELDKIVEKELETILPLEQEEIVFDYHVLPKTKEINGMDVFSCAVSQNTIKKTISDYLNGDVVVHGIIPTGISYGSLIHKLCSLKELNTKDEPVAIIDIGASKTSLSIFQKNKALFSRTISYGGMNITKAMSSELNIDFEQAESMKKTTHNTDVKDKTLEIINKELTPLICEIQKTFRVLSVEHDCHLTKILLTGGSCRIKGIDTLFAQSIGIPTEMISSQGLLNMDNHSTDKTMDLDVFYPAASIACNGSDGYLGFDLAKKMQTKESNFSFLKEKFVPLTISLVLICLFWIGSAYASFYNANRSNLILREQLAISSTEMFGQSLSSEQVLLRIKTKNNDESPIPEVTAYDMLLQINEAFPSDKNSIEVNDLSIDIAHNSVSLRAYAKDIRDVTETEKKLENMQCFENISRGEVSAGPDDMKDFSWSIKTTCE